MIRNAQAAVVAALVVSATTTAARAQSDTLTSVFGPEAERTCYQATSVPACANRVERKALRAVPRTVTRNGRTLAIRTATHGTLYFHDHAETVYRYFAYFPVIARHVVLVEASGETSFLLVGARDGSQVEVDERPVASPDGHRFLVARSDPDAGNLLEIWGLSGAEVKREYGLEPAWTPDHPHWTGEREVALDRLDSQGNVSGSLLLRLGPGGWSLEDGAAAEPSSAGLRTSRGPAQSQRR